MEWKKFREELDFGGEEDGVSPGGQINRVGCCYCC